MVETHGTYLFLGMKIDHLDMLIGATALHENLIVVTGNTNHFERIPNLQIENWMKA